MKFLELVLKKKEIRFVILGVHWDQPFFNVITIYHFILIMSRGFRKLFSKSFLCYRDAKMPRFRRFWALLPRLCSGHKKYRLFRLPALWLAALPCSDPGTGHKKRADIWFRGVNQISAQIFLISNILLAASLSLDLKEYIWFRGFYWS